MELKPYQQQVITDLEKYLEYLDEYKVPSDAFNKYWADKGMPSMVWDHEKIFLQLLMGEKKKNYEVVHHSLSDLCFHYFPETSSSFGTNHYCFSFYIYSDRIDCLLSFEPGFIFQT